MSEASEPEHDIEFVSQQVSAWRAVNPGPPAEFLLTPRSKEALRRTGIEAEDLLVRDASAFTEPGVTPEIAQVRYEAYRRRRQKLLRAARRERAQLSQAEVAAAASPLPSHRSSVGSLRSERGQHLVSSSAIGMEQERLEKLRERKRRELEVSLRRELDDAVQRAVR